MIQKKCEMKNLAKVNPLEKMKYKKSEKFDPP